MNARSKIDMMEATRLTREGRLEEAMAVLLGASSGVSPGGTPADEPSEAGQSPGSRRSSILDMVAPSPGTGGAWTFPNLGESITADAAMQQQMPEALRQLGMGKLAVGLNGKAGPLRARPPIAVPDGARFEERSFVNHAGSRTYKLYVPSGYREGQAVPLVVMLHGCTQSPDDFAAGTRMNDLAEAQVFLVAYPAQAQSANTSKCWNWFSPADQERDRGEPSLIAGITRQIVGDFSVDPGRVYVAGLSAGGAAAAIMGSTYPDLYAAIGVHSGLPCGAASDMPSAFAAMRQGGPSGAEAAVPTIVFHGDRDTTVSPINGHQVIAQTKPAANLRKTMNRGESPGGVSYTLSVQADESGRSMVEHWVLHGTGHAWSGGSAAGSYTEPRGPDASREMVRFFLQHSTGATFPQER